MLDIEFFQINAFTNKIFHGNPAGVCLINEGLNEELMQAIAVENSLSETAFIIEKNDGYHLRCFTPKGEINLCGHATLAAGFILFEMGKNQNNTVKFSTLGGTISVTKNQELYTINLPRLNCQPSAFFSNLVELVNQPVLEAFDGELDYLMVLPDEQAVAQVEVNLSELQQLPKRGLVITARSTEPDIDFYSRCFFPKHSISEDPVTGSAQSMLAPFWADRLGKNTLRAVQGSLRKGEIYSEVEDNSVHISGYCKLYLKGSLVI